jgi:hypothetical protein
MVLPKNRSKSPKYYRLLLNSGASSTVRSLYNCIFGSGVALVLLSHRFFYAVESYPRLKILHVGASWRLRFES